MTTSAAPAAVFGSGTATGEGTYRCRVCDYTISMQAGEPLPECPNCGEPVSFARASLFEQATVTSPDLQLDDRTPEWLDEVRAGIERPGRYLALEDSEERVSVVRLRDGWNRIGRSAAADIRIDDPTVSRRHALIVCEPLGVRVLDDRSLNGLFLNGAPTEWCGLTDGDEIAIGRYRLFFIDTLAALIDRAA